MATPKRGILAQPSSGSASQSACKRKRVIFNTVDIAEESSSDSSMDVTATVRYLVQFGVLSSFGFIHYFSEDDAGRYCVIMEEEMLNELFVVIVVLVVLIMIMIILLMCPFLQHKIIYTRTCS